MKLYQHLTYQVEDRVGYITLNRPDKRNALNDVLMVELRDAFMQAEQSAEVKVIVLKGNGPAFCAGADLDYLRKLQGYTMEQNMADSSALASVFLTIYRSTKVVIAQIEGHAIAGGCGLATVCDFAFSVPDAKFGYTEVRIGFVPAVVMTFLLRKVGETRGKELMLSGSLIDAQTAVDYDLINRVIPADEMEGYVKEFAQKLCQKNSSASMQLTKKMIADIQDFPLENAIKFAAKMNAHARTTPDCQRGIQAFLDKEKIQW
ncbi:enoyl-CoA hydratase-related protein [Pontibacter sp. G13]|uniref:enoyl-CoA hydratase/isomerase family protein n=1 Tax=Pontibacter sp. G13 TaxID=3074898 RepID=UPI0028890CC0|nr:enoyl-CoA hydratase-related protein [Pontibacter sp. G13]WNJ17446.1 enoyl-CoA hydratase-related protein [Pontibacter sp. G13]